MAATKPTVSFQDRYASDDHFRRQVDDGRKRAAAERTHKSVKESLAMIRGAHGSKKKFY